VLLIGQTAHGQVNIDGLYRTAQYFDDRAGLWTAFGLLSYNRDFVFSANRRGSRTDSF